MKMKYNILIFVIFASIAQLSCAQGKYVIKGELPDHLFDNEYILLYNNVALIEEPQRMKQTFIDSIKVIDGKFCYEGVLSQQPFLAYLSCDKGLRFRYTTSFIVEQGEIQLHFVDWVNEANVSGTPINDDYNVLFIESEKVSQQIVDERRIAFENVANNNYDKRRIDSLHNVYVQNKEKRFRFLEKYAQYPNVVRVQLAMLIDPVMSQDPELERALHIVDLMPKVERDILLAWREYRVKLIEHMAKVKALKDSLDANKPRFVETIPNTSLSTVEE